MSFTVNYKLKDFFFDRSVVERSLDTATKKNLSQAGRFVRTRARTSMKRRKNRVNKKTGKEISSPPGRPPFAWSEDPVATLKNILFAYDPSRQSVIVGPVGLNQKQYLGGQLRAGTVPELHEFGGRMGFREKRVGKTWRSIGRRKPRPGQPTRVRTAVYPARPYMGPALEAEAPKFPDLWHNSVRAA
jgi:hypothetical protein